MKTRNTELRRELLTDAAGLLIASGMAWSQTAPHQAERKTIVTMQEDLVHRAQEIHWPGGLQTAKAGLFSHNELPIDAPCERVWQHNVDATKWPVSAIQKEPSWS